MKKRITALMICSFVGTGLSTSAAQAETSSAEANHTIVSEPEKVYVESNQGSYRGTSSSTYRSTRSDEYCFFNEEHQHIHCYDEDPESLDDRVVIVENRTSRTTSRTTRRPHCNWYRGWYCNWSTYPRTPWAS